MLDITRKLENNGYVVLEASPDKKVTEIADEIGVLYKPKNMPLVQTLKPRSVEEKDNTYSGNYGYGMFPFHTDMAHWVKPPRFFMLRCSFPSGITTNILHHEKLLQKLDVNLTSRALFKPRRKVDGKIHLLRFLSNDLMRWDSLFIVPANKKGEQLKAGLESELTCVSYDKIALDQVGKCILIDNWKVLHGRGPTIEGGNSSRVVERVYFEGLAHEY